MPCPICHAEGDRHEFFCHLPTNAWSLVDLNTRHLVPRSLSRSGLDARASSGYPEQVPITVYAPRPCGLSLPDLLRVQYVASSARHSAAECASLADSYVGRRAYGARPEIVLNTSLYLRDIDILGAHPLTCDLGAKLQTLRALVYGLCVSRTIVASTPERYPVALARLFAAQPAAFREAEGLALELEDAGDGLYVSGPTPPEIAVGTAYWGTPNPARIPLRDVLREIAAWTPWLSDRTLDSASEA